MLTPDNFFDLKDFSHKGLFSENEAVWTALDRLKDYLATFFQKSWPLSKTTGLIEKALVIYNDEVRNDLEVKTSGPNDSIQVFLKGSPSVRYCKPSVSLLRFLPQRPAPASCSQTMYRSAE